MKLLIIECGTSKLSSIIETQARTLNPKPEYVSSMQLSMERVNIPEVKRMLQHMAPDTIILNPPSIVPDERVFNALITEIARAVSILNGRLLFVSSVEVLGDAYLRTEASMPLPYSEVGTFLLMAETQIESTTPRSYIFRVPYTEESLAVQRWVSWAKELRLESWDPSSDKTITLADTSELAKIILDRVQSGWFGKYHVTPNDYLLLSKIIKADWYLGGRPADASLMSKYIWKMSWTRNIWDKLCAA